MSKWMDEGDELCLPEGLGWCVGDLDVPKSKISSRVNNFFIFHLSMEIWSTWKSECTTNIIYFSFDLTGEILKTLEVQYKCSLLVYSSSENKVQYSTVGKCFMTSFTPLHWSWSGAYHVANIFICTGGSFQTQN